MIVWLSSYPRSGNSYCRYVIYTCCGRPSVDEYAIGRQDSRPYIQYTNASLDELQASDETFLVKTHHLPRSGDCSDTIYLVRDGRDALVSYAWFHLTRDRELLPEQISSDLYAATLRELIWEPNSPFGAWSQNIHNWLDRAAGVTTKVLRFEEFVQQPEIIVQAAEGLGLRQSPRSCNLPTVDALREMSPNAFRRGVVGSWRDEFPPELLDDFWRQNGSAMQRLGYGENEAPLPGQAAAAVT